MNSSVLDLTSLSSADVSCTELQSRYTYGETLQPYWLLVCSVIVFGVLGSLFGAVWWSVVSCCLAKRDSSGDDDAGATSSVSLDDVLADNSHAYFESLNSRSSVTYLTIQSLISVFHFIYILSTLDATSSFGKYEEAYLRYINSGALTTLCSVGIALVGGRYHRPMDYGHTTTSHHGGSISLNSHPDATNSDSTAGVTIAMHAPAASKKPAPTETTSLNPFDSTGSAEYHRVAAAAPVNANANSRFEECCASCSAGLRRAGSDCTRLCECRSGRRSCGCDPEQRAHLLLVLFVVLTLTLFPPVLTHSIPMLFAFCWLVVLFGLVLACSVLLFMLPIYCWEQHCRTFTNLMTPIVLRFAVTLILVMIIQTLFHYGVLLYRAQTSYIEAIPTELNLRSTDCYFNGVASDSQDLVSFFSLF